MKNFVREIEVALKTTSIECNLGKISSSQDLVDFLYPVWEKDINLVERMYVIVFDKANQIIGYMPISQGGFNYTTCCFKYLFSAVLGAGGSSFALAHNHPSGNMTPSKQDDDITKRIKEASKILDIQFLDHIIIGPDAIYYSYADGSSFFNFD